MMTFFIVLCAFVWAVFGVLGWERERLRGDIVDYLMLPVCMLGGPFTLGILR